MLFDTVASVLEPVSREEERARLQNVEFLIKAVRSDFERPRLGYRSG